RYLRQDGRHHEAPGRSRRRAGQTGRENATKCHLSRSHRSSQPIDRDHSTPAIRSSGKQPMKPRFRTALLSLPFLLGLVCLASMSTQRATRAAGANQNQDQDDVVRVNTDLVVVNATVLDKDGKFVSGLKLGDFHLFEDGAEQKVVSFTTEKTPFAAAILLDTSGSMEPRLTLGRSAALRFLDGLRENDVAAVYNFDIKVEQLQDFSPGRDLPDRAYGLR